MSSPSSRRTLLYGAVAVVAAAAGAGGAWWSRREGGDAAGGADSVSASFWEKKFDRPEGGEIVFATLRKKPVMINFWATWCAPCVEEMPMIDRFYKESGTNGAQIIGLAIDQPSSVRKFLQRTPVSYPIGLAGLEGTELLRELGNTGGGLPFTLVLGADGNITARKMGKLEQSDLDTWRRALFHG